MPGPIKPEEVGHIKAEQIPEQVYEAFNKLIAENWNGSSATVKQPDVVALIVSTMNISKQEVFARHYLDVEPIYREAGWVVTYDKPGYYENYDAFFVFEKE